MKDEKIESFYIRSFVVIVATTILTLMGLHSLEFALILFPILFIVNSIQNGLKEGITNMSMTLVIISIVESLAVGLLLAIAFVPFTIVISILIKERKGNAKIIGYSSFVFFGSILFMLVLVKTMGIDIVRMMEEVSLETLDFQLETLKDLGLGNYEFFIRKEMLEDTYKYLLLIIPSLLLILSAMVTYINYLLSGIILERLEIKIVNIPRFSRLKLPDNIMLGALIMFAITFLAGELGFLYYQTVFVNIVALLIMSFFIQGFSVADFFLNKLKIKTVFKVIFYIFFIFNPSMVSVITMIGLIDTVIDMRKLRKRRSL